MRVNKKVLAVVLVAVIVIVLVVLEFYAHTYVSSLDVIDEEEALASMLYYNGTYHVIGSSSGCVVRWLVAWRLLQLTFSENYVYIYLFKVERNSNLWVHDLEVIPTHIDPTVNTTGFYADLEETIFYPNYTVIRVRYGFTAAGTYEVDFGLHAKVYAKTIVGYLPAGEIEVPVQKTLFYGP